MGRWEGAVLPIFIWVTQQDKREQGGAGCLCRRCIPGVGVDPLRLEAQRLQTRNLSGDHAVLEEVSPLAGRSMGEFTICCGASSVECPSLSQFSLHFNLFCFFPTVFDVSILPGVTELKSLLSIDLLLLINFSHHSLKHDDLHLKSSCMSPEMACFPLRTMSLG